MEATMATALFSREIISDRSQAANDINITKYPLSRLSLSRAFIKLLWIIITAAIWNGNDYNYCVTCHSLALIARRVPAEGKYELLTGDFNNGHVIKFGTVSPEFWST